jgi:hypothetical protein
MLIEIDKDKFINIANICFVYGKQNNRNPISSTEQFQWIFYCNEGYPRKSKEFKSEAEARKWLFNMIGEIKE